MSIKQVLGKDFCGILNSMDYVVIEDSNEQTIFENTSNKSKLIFKRDIYNGEVSYSFNLENKKGEKNYVNDLYIGNKYGIDRDIILNELADKETKKFCDVSFSWEEEKSHEHEKRIEEQKTDVSSDDTIVKSILNISFNDLNRIINKYNFEFNCIFDDKIYIRNKNLFVTLCIYIEDNSIFIEEISTSLARCIGNVAEDIREHLEVFLDDIIQEKSRIKANENLNEDFKNIKIHKGTEKENKSELSDTQKNIRTICYSIFDLLVYKNQKYGNSALKPNNVFYKGNAETSILIRLDDKIGRIKNNPDKELRYNDVIDIIGYLVLYLVLKGIRPEDIQKLKD